LQRKTKNELSFIDEAQEKTRRISFGSDRNLGVGRDCLLIPPPKQKSIYTLSHRVVTYRTMI
jgi:hypothetical protein